MSTSVEYKDSILTTLTNQTKKLKTAGKYLEDDVKITDVSEVPGLLFITDSDDNNGGIIRSIVTQDGTITDTIINNNSTARDISGIEIYLQQKRVTPTEQEQQIEPDQGYNALAKVQVGAIPSTYMGSAVSTKDSSDLTISGATVSAAAGYYPDGASATVSSGSVVTPATTITAKPTISVNSSGLITASVSTSQNITPTVSAGYITSGTAGAVTVSGSTTSQLSTQAATTATPTESEQTIVSSGKYTTGAIKVAAIPSTYVGSGISTKSSASLTANGATVTAPAGYYANAATKAVAAGSVTAPSSITGTSASVSTASNSVTFTKTVSVTPNVTNAGYISSGTAGNSNVSLTASITPRNSGNLTTSGATVTAPAGYYPNAATKAIASGTQGTPTATKGTVSNHTINVTPSVTNSAGYISGGTKTGTAVSVSASQLVSGSTTLTNNGTYAVTNLSSVAINVATGDTINNQNKTVDPSSASQSVTYDNGYTGLGTVTVNAIPSTYVGQGITSRSSSSLSVNGATVTAPAGYYSAAATKAVAAGTVTAPEEIYGTGATLGYSKTSGYITLRKIISVTPRVTSAGYISSGTAGNSTVDLYASCNINDSGSLTVNGATVTAPVGYYPAAATKAISAGSAGTPTATKGTVSNHQVSVTPSVTNTAGYISGGTKTGTGVSVSASELVSGTLPITQNGTADVTNYASVNVAVSSASETYKTTITSTGHNGRAYVIYPYPNGTKYYTIGDTFDIEVGKTMYLFAVGSVGGGSIYVNGIQVATDPYDQVSYQFEITKKENIEIELSSGSSSSVLLTEVLNEISITTNGLHDVSDYDYANINVSKEESFSAPKKQINFIDYDGTILHSYTASEWANVSDLPANPSHDNLTSQGWNWTKAQIDAQLTAMPNNDIWVGQMYITTSGDTEIDVVFADSARLSPILTIAVNGTVTVDWGDNTTVNTVTGTSISTRLEVTHTYTSAGSYTIKIHTTLGSFSFIGSTSYTLLRKNTTANENRVYANTIKAVRFGRGITGIDENAFVACYSLASVTIPNSITTINTNAFSNCYSLVSVTIPSGVTAIYSAFYNCYSLASAAIPSGVTIIGNNAFYYCYALASVTIPSNVVTIGYNAFVGCSSLASIAISSGVTSIGSSTFNYCYSLASITIPSGITSIDNNAFSNCYGMAEYHVKPTTPPTLGSNVFQNIVSDCKIYVPSASLSAYQTASNWSAYASYMVGE